MAPEESVEVEDSAGDEGPKPALIFAHLKLPFLLLLLCFIAWGAAQDLTNSLVSVFTTVFAISSVQAALIQTAYFGAYFSLAIPAAYINKRFGYKTGVVAGLGIAAVGGVLFLPATSLLSYPLILVAYFVLASGLSMLETSANPFVIAMGPVKSATQRLNLAQAFNPVGTNIGVLLSLVLILPALVIKDDDTRKKLSGSTLHDSQVHDMGVVVRPYLGIAAVLVIVGVLIFLRKMSTPAEEKQQEREEKGEASSKGVLSRLYRNRLYRYGVVAQFFNVGAQVCTWSFTIQYGQDILGMSKTHAGFYLQAGAIVFLLSRFLMTYLLGIFRPTKLLLAMASLGVLLGAFAAISQSEAGLIAVVMISLSLSLMFPTIYGVALKGLGDDTKFGAAGLVMAILGGALLPVVHGAVADATNQATAYVVPAICMAVVAAYALFELRTSRHVPEVAAAH
ncbi:MAG TPA: L-fucose:H+ symporter permease [Pseudonocardia sp.]